MVMHGQTRKTVPTSPGGAMMFFGNSQIFDNIGNKMKKKKIIKIIPSIQVGSQHFVHPLCAIKFTDACVILESL